MRFYLARSGILLMWWGGTVQGLVRGLGLLVLLLFTVCAVVRSSGPGLLLLTRVPLRLSLRFSVPSLSICEHKGLSHRVTLTK